MSAQHYFVSCDQSDRDLYARERVLNGAIVQVDIGKSFEEYLEIFDAFYADDIEISAETERETIHGKGRVRSLLFNFLVPLHIMAEVGGLSVSVRETPIRGGSADETHSAWTVDLAGVSGTTCSLTWCTLRKWNGPRVVYERHYDQRQSGEPLTFNDLSFNASNPAARHVRRHRM
jgi:hypothetical protein